MQNKAIIIYGPPGSGKGTQAELIARRHNLIHFDTGRYIEALVHSKEAEEDPILMRERKNFDTGILCTPSWTIKIVRDVSNRIGRAGFGVVFSGSPRTVFEAFGDKKNKGLFQELIGLYRKSNLQIIKLKVHDETSVKRNVSRLVCSNCGLPILAHAKIRRCAFCDGYTRKRVLDKPEIMKVRLKEYRERTYPIIAQAKKIGIKIFEVNGEPLPYKVLNSIEKKLKLKK